MLGAVVLLALLAKAAEGAECACATSAVHVRSGAGTGYHVIGTLQHGSCVTYKGRKQAANGYTWANVDYNEQTGWAATNWLQISDCSGGSGRPGDECTSYKHAKYGQTGHCLSKSCCAFATYISSLCAGDDQACCFTQDTCGGSSSSSASGACPGSHTYHARGTAYYPADDPIEGGFVDMRGHKLNTLQDYLEGHASYVSVAMDNKAGIAYGTKICIPELNTKYNKNIVFEVVDTGSAFFGKGHSRIDICVRSRSDSYDATINGPLTLVFP